MKISKTEIDKLIKEELHRMVEKKKLSTRLSRINEELNKMGVETPIEEVEAVGIQKTKSATGLIPGEQHGVKFEKIGSHLKEEDEMELEAGEEMETPEAEMGEFELKFAELGKAIDAKISKEEKIGAEMESEIGEKSEEPSEEDFEDVEVEDEMEPEAGETEEHEAEETPEEEKEEEEKEEEIKESVDEPLEGHSVAQETSADKVNDNMKKDTHVQESKTKTGKVISESKKPAKKNIFTEGLDVRKKQAMSEEFNRMRKFAGLSRDEE